MECKGSYKLGTACGQCPRCTAERTVIGTFVTHAEAVAYYAQRAQVDTPMADLTQAVRELVRGRYPFLVPEFLEAMNDIGKHGFQKYGAASFHAHRLAGHGRDGMSNRALPSSYIQHAAEHGQAYLRMVPHDHFGTAIHQLAAAAFNVMMEAYFASNKDI